MSELAKADEHNSACQGLYRFQVQFPYRRMNIGFSQVETARAMNLNAKTFALFEQGVLEDKSLRRELKETLAVWLLAREGRVSGDKWGIFTRSNFQQFGK